jgi:C1A family cysteine protease
MSRQIARFGWIPDPPDPRDHVGPLTLKERTVALPASVSLRPKMPAVYDQGQLGSCTANAIAGAVQYQQMRQAETEGSQIPSRLFIYYEERRIEGTIPYDAGANIRDGIKVVANEGAPAETDWPYNINHFARKPPAQAYTDALQYRALSYGHPMRTSYYLRNALAVGHPITFGFTVYSSFPMDATDAAQSLVPMPDEYQEEILGGHAVLAVGYKLINGHLYFEVRNSWGPGWGDSGYFWMPLAYLLDPGLSSDFWVIRTES